MQKLPTYLTLSFNGILTKYHRLWYYYKDTEAAYTVTPLFNN